MPVKKQWVNLEKRNAFVEDDIASLGQLGPCHYEVTFQKAKPELYKVRVTARSEPSTYTAQEKARNPRFGVQLKKVRHNAGKKKVRIDADVSLPAAGGNVYVIRTKYKKSEHETSEGREAWRRLYYQAVEMKLAGPASPAADVGVPDLTPTENRYKALYVELKRKGGSGPITFKEYIDIENWTGGRLFLMRQAKAAYGLRTHEPYAFIAAFVNSIASRKEREFLHTDSPTHMLGSRLLNWSEDEITWELPGGSYLWYGLDAADDAANGGKGWLFRNSCVLVDSSGVEHPVPDANVTVDVTKKRSPLGGYNTLRIKVPQSARNVFSSKQVRVEIKLWVVKGFLGGYSEPSYNFITVAKRSWWQENTDAKRIQVLNHELGHKIGMVPEGTVAGNELDRGAYLYGGSRRQTDDAGKPIDQQGHQGPHCGKDVNYRVNRTLADGTRADWQGTPGCVMFGATSCIDPVTGRHKPAPETYCPECDRQVKKLDLDGSNLDGFKKSIRTL